MKSYAIAAVLAVAMLVVATQASADTVYGFTAISSNNAGNVAIGEAQLSMTVSDMGGGYVGFTFNNEGALNASITQVYFDDGTLIGPLFVHDDSGAGVAFSQVDLNGGQDLPGAPNINFHTTAGFSADSDSPVQPTGVNPGEWLTIKFKLLDGKTYSDTIAALDLGVANPGVDMFDGLRVGLQVQGLGADAKGSEQYVNGGGTAVVPLPPAVFAGMALCGMLGIGKLRRRSAAAD